jgi:hypothetical protein
VRISSSGGPSAVCQRYPAGDLSAFQPADD